MRRRVALTGDAPATAQTASNAGGLRKDKVLGRIRAIRGGKLNDPRFGSRMRGEGILAEHISQMFHVACRKVGLSEEGPKLSTTAFKRAQGPQLALGI